MIASALLVGTLIGAVGYRTFKIERDAGRHAARMAALATSTGKAYAVVIGDSITERGNWRDIDGCSPIANFGVSGDQSSDVLARLDAPLALRPAVVVVMIGTNDIGHSIPPHETAGRVAEIARRTTAAGSRVVVTLPPPTTVKDKDAEPTRMAISAAIARSGIGAVVDAGFDTQDLDPDGVHLRPAAYAKWQRALAPHLAGCR